MLKYTGSTNLIILKIKVWCSQGNILGVKVLPCKIANCQSCSRGGHLKGFPPCKKNQLTKKVCLGGREKHFDVLASSQLN